MSRNLRGRLGRLERAAPAQETSILANGRIWDLVCGAGDATPAEAAEWAEIWRGLGAAGSPTDQVEQRIAEEAGRPV